MGDTRVPRVGVQSLEPLGLPPATDAPQVTVREGFTLSLSGFTPFTRMAPWRPSPSQSTNHQPQAALTPQLGDPSKFSRIRPPLSLVSASPELKGEDGEDGGDQLAGRPAETHGRLRALSPGPSPLERAAPNRLGEPPCSRTPPPYSRHRPGPQAASRDDSGTCAQHSSNCSSVKECQPRGHPQEKGRCRHQTMSLNAHAGVQTQEHPPFQILVSARQVPSHQGGRSTRILQRSQWDCDRPLLQRQHPQPGASPKLTPPCGRRGRAATRLHWGPREESCQTPSPSQRGQPRREPLPAAVLLRSSDAGPAHRGLDDHPAPGNILERRQGLSEDSKNRNRSLPQNFPVS